MAEKVVAGYVLGSTLGGDATGTVWSAHDPELDRLAAIKLLPLQRLGPDDAERLLQDGEALTRLSHPSVAQVFDVGRHDDSIYVATALVDGQTLDQWLGDRRPWQEIVRVFIAAAQGLAAAHARGLIHADFGPDKLRIDAKGEVKVLDIGLAPAHRDKGPLSPYWAAEQLGGDSVDRRVDQHALCVSLYEALFGRRPFVGADDKELRQKIAKGRIGSRPAGDTPRALWLIIRRGVRPDPARRFASMSELVRALHGVLPHKAKHPYRTAATGVAALAGLAAWFIFVPNTDPCHTPADPLAGVWDPELRDAAIMGISGTGVGFGPDVRDRVIVDLDSYAKSWNEQRTEICEALISGEDDRTRLLERRMQCLSEGARQLGALAQVLSTPDVQTVERAIAAARQLPPLARCRDTEALLTGVDPPKDKEKANQVDEILAELARVRAQQSTGRAVQARAQMPKLIEHAKTIGYQPLVADALRLDGDLAVDVGDYPGAQERLEGAYETAVAQGNDHSAATTALRLAGVIDDSVGPDAQSEAWLRRADEATARLHGDDVRDLHAKLAVARGNHAYRAGHFAEALEQLTSARALFSAAAEPDELAIAGVDLTMGAVLGELGRWDEGLATLDGVRVVYVDALGEHHPYLALVHGAIANVHRLAGDAALAAEQTEIGLQIVQEAYGQDHPQAARSYEQGRVLTAAGRVREGEDALRAALTAAEQTLANDDRLAIDIRRELASALRTTEREQAAAMAPPVAPTGVERADDEAEGKDDDAEIDSGD